MSAERGAGWVKSPVSPVGAPASRYLEGFTEAKRRIVARIVNVVRRVNGLVEDGEVVRGTTLASFGEEAWRGTF